VSGVMVVVIYGDVFIAFSGSNQTLENLFQTIFRFANKPPENNQYFLKINILE
jgi:hypothetical protein